MHGHSFTLPRPNPTVSPQSRCVRWSGRRHRPRNDVLLAQAPAEGGRLAQQAPASTAMIPPVAVPARLADIAATPTKRAARLSRTPVTLDIARQSRSRGQSTISREFQVQNTSAAIASTAIHTHVKIEPRAPAPM